MCFLNMTYPIVGLGHITIKDNFISNDLNKLEHHQMYIYELATSILKISFLFYIYVFCDS